MFFVNDTHAELLDRGGGLIYDTSSNLTWLQGVNLSGSAWNDAMSWAANLAYYDSARDVYWDDWRLPSTSYCFNDCANSEMGYLNYNSLGNQAGGTLNNTGLFGDSLEPTRYWTSREYVENFTHFVFFYNFGNGRQDYDGVANGLRAMAVRTGDVDPATVVPEPISSSLFIIGGATLGIRRFWKKRKTA